jgi:hypothetical protein
MRGRKNTIPMQSQDDTVLLCTEHDFLGPIAKRVRGKFARADRTRWTAKIYPIRPNAAPVMSSGHKTADRTSPSFMESGVICIETPASTESSCAPAVHDIESPPVDALYVDWLVEDLWTKQYAQEPCADATRLAEPTTCQLFAPVTPEYINYTRLEFPDLMIDLGEAYDCLSLLDDQGQ